MKQYSVAKAILWDETMNTSIISLKDILEEEEIGFFDDLKVVEYLKEFNKRCDKLGLIPVISQQGQDRNYFSKSQSDRLEWILKRCYSELRVVNLMDEYKAVKNFNDQQAFEENWRLDKLGYNWFALACWDAYTYWYDVCDLEWAKVVIVDLDGTTIDNTERYKKCFNKDTNKLDYDFYHRDDYVYRYDKVIDKVQNEIVELRRSWYRVIVITGRPTKTVFGSLAHMHFPYDGLFMRQIKDHSPSNEYKERMLKTILPYLDLSKTIVYDDRKQDIDMYEKHGLFVVNCGGEDNDF